MDERTVELSDHGERMENDRIANMVYVRECAGSRSVGRQCRRWINTVKDCLRKRFRYQRSKENGT